MKIIATRTLMKSAPELWELLDDEPQLRHWSARLCDGDGDGAVEVTAREPGRLLIWRCDGMKVKVKLAEKGFGTQVAIAARAHDGLKKSQLDEVLDELAEPQRRPFSAV
jgi:streptomycin 6-kinase